MTLEITIRLMKKKIVINRNKTEKWKENNGCVSKVEICVFEHVKSTKPPILCFWYTAIFWYGGFVLLIHSLFSLPFPCLTTIFPKFSLISNIKKKFIYYYFLKCFTFKFFVYFFSPNFWQPPIVLILIFKIHHHFFLSIIFFFCHFIYILFNFFSHRSVS